MIDSFTQGMLIQCLCDLAALQAEVEGMKATNKELEWGKAPPRYQAQDFMNLASDMMSIGNQAREFGQRGS